MRTWSAISIVTLSLSARGLAEVEVVGVSSPRHSLSTPVGAPLHIDFDQSLDPSSVTSQTVRAFGRWTGPIRGSWQLAGTRLTLVPERPLAAGDLITVTLSDGLRGEGGDRFRGGGYTHQFWTRSQQVGDLTFTPIASLTTGNPSRPYGGVATDLNHDGWLDITTVNEDSADLRVFLNRGDGAGTFEPYLQPTFGVGRRASPSASADFNNDGNADVTVANIDDNTISVVFGNGDGSFAPQQMIDVGPVPRGIAVLDADGDGDADIVNTNLSNTDNLSLHLNNGAGGFGEATMLDAGVAGAWSLASGDMNNDGILDLVVASGTRPQIRVLAGNGDGTFTPQPRQNTGGRSWQIALGDVNGDGQLDVSSANARNNQASILWGNGDGSLEAPTIYDIANMGSGGNGFPLATDLGDMDGDGDLDWVTSSFNGDWIVLRNDGKGAFDFFAQLAAPSAASCSLIHDFDNDGDLDLGLIDELANVVILSRNDGMAVPEATSPMGIVAALLLLLRRRDDQVAARQTAHRAAISEESA